MAKKKAADSYASFERDVKKSVRAARKRGEDWTRETFAFEFTDKGDTSPLFLPGLFNFTIAGRVFASCTGDGLLHVENTCHFGIWNSAPHCSLYVGSGIEGSPVPRQCGMLEYHKILALSRAISRCGLWRNRRKRRSS